MHYNSIIKIVEEKCNLNIIRIYLDTNLELVIVNKNVYLLKVLRSDLFLRFLLYLQMNSTFCSIFFKKINDYFLLLPIIVYINSMFNFLRIYLK